MNVQPSARSPVGARQSMKTLLPWAVIASLVAVLFAWSPGYISHLLVMLGIYLLLAYSLNLVMGYGGLIVFCHGLFYGIGAYAYALARVRLVATDPQAAVLWWAQGWSFLPASLFAVVTGAVVAALVAWVCLRFRGEQFIFATLGFQMIFFVVLYNCVDLSRGPSGIYGIPRPSLFGWSVTKPWQYSLLVGVVVVGVLLFLFRLYRSPFGLVLQTMREDERAARAMGVNTNEIALRAFAVAGGIAALAGSLYAGYVTYIDPSSFSLEESIFVVILLMLGGSGNIRGPFIGTVIMLALPEVLRFVGLPDAVAANVRRMIYGAALVAFIYWRPGGLAGTKTRHSQP